MAGAHQESRPESDEIDFREFRRRLWVRRWLIVVITALSSGLFFGAAFLIKPKYLATTVLLPISNERSSLSGSLTNALGSLGGLASLAGVNIGGGSDAATAEAIAVLQSRQFTEKFISENNLMPRLYSRKWDSDAGRWRVAADRQPTPAEAFKYFNDSIRTVTQDRKTDMVSLQIEWKDRNEAASWANDLARRLNAEMRTRAIDKSEAALGFLEKELQSTTVLETKQAINRLIEAQIRQRMIANVSPEYVFRVVDPAMAPDADDPIWPKKLLLTGVGAILGFALGGLLALVLGANFKTT